MSVPALPRFLSILSRDDVRVLRNMRRSLAASWLRARYPDMDASDMTEALALAPESVALPVTLAPADPVLRNLFIAGAWLAGGSLTKLAGLHGLTRQRIMEIVHRVVPGDRAQRASLRVGRGGEGMRSGLPPIPSDTLVAWQDAWWAFVRMSDPGEVATMEALEVALVLPHLPGAAGEDDTSELTPQRIAELLPTLPKVPS